MARICRSCVNRRRRELHAAKGGKTLDEKLPRLEDLVKKGDLAAIKKRRSSITAGNRDRLLVLAVRDFKRAPKKPSHVELVRFLIESGARPDFHLVCAATVGPHTDIMNALIEAGAEKNIFTAAAQGDVDRLSELLSRDPTLKNSTTDYELLGERNMTALHYACRSELGKADGACANRLYVCAGLLLMQESMNAARSRDEGGSVLGSLLEICAWRGGNVEIARLLIAHGARPSTETVLAALGHFQRHGRGNYDVAALCLEAGVDINTRIGGRTLLHAFAHQGDLTGTTWLLERGASVDARDDGNDTPLHKACERNSTLRVVELLIERGASLTATNNNGETALDVAIRNDKKAIAAYLRRGLILGS